MSNISPPRGYTAPFNVGSAAKEGGGNGSGGMYFGQEEEPQDEQPWYAGTQDPLANADLEDIPFVPPAHHAPLGLDTIRTALAVSFYNGFAKNPVPFLGESTPAE